MTNILYAAGVGFLVGVFLSFGVTLIIRPYRAALAFFMSTFAGILGNYFFGATLSIGQNVQIAVQRGQNTTQFVIAIIVNGLLIALVLYLISKKGGA